MQQQRVEVEGHRGQQLVGEAVDVGLLALDHDQRLVVGRVAGHPGELRAALAEALALAGLRLLLLRDEGLARMEKCAEFGVQFAHFVGEVVGVDAALVFGLGHLWGKWLLLWHHRWNKTVSQSIVVENVHQDLTSSIAIVFNLSVSHRSKFHLFSDRI